MILTCPSCGTQYVVKDGAIPPQGRQVRCASCRHSWHQDPEPLALTEEVGSPAEAEAIPEEPVQEEASEPVLHTEEARAQSYEPDPTDETRFVSTPADEIEAPVPPSAHSEPVGEWPEEVGADDRDEDDFSPFRERGPAEDERRNPLLKAIIAIVLIGALAAAFWFLAPPEWKERVGLGSAGATPLQLMMTHSDRQALASGNELLQVSGRVINPTDQKQPVPPITAELKSSSGELIYSWTIAPPARELAPRASASFNSAEVNVPAGGEELTITLGSPKA